MSIIINGIETHKGFVLSISEPKYEKVIFDREALVERACIWNPSKKEIQEVVFNDSEGITKGTAKVDAKEKYRKEAFKYLWEKNEMKLNKFIISTGSDTTET
jgi:hypothetical protein